MKTNKKILIVFIAIFSLWLIGSEVAQAQVSDYVEGLLDDGRPSEVEFTPNISIPGTEFEGTATVSTGDLIGTYIISLYKYGAGLAGVVAMFMLVFAGWKWLMAAGSADKISSAKDIISGVLVGLLLLFGGQLLLSQISTRLVHFDELTLPTIDTIESDANVCRSLNLTTVDAVGCGSILPVNATSSVTGNSLICVDTTCTDVSPTAVCIKSDTLDECPAALSPVDVGVECRCVDLDCNNISACDQYPTRDACVNNVCYAQLGRVCGMDDGDDECNDIEDVRCDSNNDCFIDLNPVDGSSEYCCEDRDWMRGDYCREIQDDTNCRTDGSL